MRKTCNHNLGICRIMFRNTYNQQCLRRHMDINLLIEMGMDEYRHLCSLRYAHLKNPPPHFDLKIVFLRNRGHWFRIWSWFVQLTSSFGDICILPPSGKCISSPGRRGHVQLYTLYLISPASILLFFNSAPPMDCFNVFVRACEACEH